MKRERPEKFPNQQSVNDSVSRVLKEYRAQKSLSQREVAIEFQTNQSNIAQYESGVRDSSVFFQIRLAVAAQTPMIEINPEIAKLIDSLPQSSGKVITKASSAQIDSVSKVAPKAAKSKSGKSGAKTASKPAKVSPKKKTKAPLAKAKAAR